MAKNRFESPFTKKKEASATIEPSYVSSGTTADYDDTKVQKREVDAPDEQQGVAVDEAARVDSEEPDTTARPS